MLFLVLSLECEEIMFEALIWASSLVSLGIQWAFIILLVLLGAAVTLLVSYGTLYFFGLILVKFLVFINSLFSK